MKIKLAEALLRRKELDTKVKLLGQMKAPQFFETKVVRKNVTENIDDITASVPKLTASQVTAEFDFYSRQLRLVDAAIQQANWTVDIETQGDVMGDYVSAEAAKVAKAA
jgi:3-methyladenine DNA glycosylase AlkC